MYLTMRISFKLLEQQFAKNGWRQYHLFQRGTKWTKNGQEVISSVKGYTLNGILVDGDVIAEMLHISERDINIDQELVRRHYTAACRRAFIEGVQWAEKQATAFENVEKKH